MGDLAVAERCTLLVERLNEAPLSSTLPRKCPKITRFPPILLRRARGAPRFGSPFETECVETTRNYIRNVVETNKKPHGGRGHPRHVQVVFVKRVTFIWGFLVAWKPWGGGGSPCWRLLRRHCWWGSAARIGLWRAPQGARPFPLHASGPCFVRSRGVPVTRGARTPLA